MGRTLATYPRSTSQTSPLLATSICGLMDVVLKERLIRETTERFVIQGSVVDIIRQTKGLAGNFSPLALRQTLK